MIRRIISLVILAIGLAVILFGASRLPAYAQHPSPGVSSWSKPINVSRSLGESTDPAIVADQTGLVHLFWSEEVGGESGGTPGRRHGNAIAYSRWDGNSWSKPIDVVASPDGGEVWQPVVAVDSFGVLHVIWASATPLMRLYYSRAPVEQALSAQGWSPPVELTSGLPTLALPAAIAIDQQGTVHIVYSSHGYDTAVIHLASKDGGVTWSAKTPVSKGMRLVGSGTLVSGGISLAVDDGGGLHVGWSMYNQQGFGVAVYYTHSFNGGLTWSIPFMVGEKTNDDYEADWLNIATAGSNIYLVWTGIGSEPGRVYRVSRDRGLSWSPSIPFMKDLIGETESPRMVVDSASVVHLFTAARTAGAAASRVVRSSSGTRYLYWTGQGWSEPYLIPGPEPNPTSYGGFRHTATVRLGNELFDAWYDEGRGEIFVVYGKSGAPAVAPKPFEPRVAKTLGKTPSPIKVFTPTIVRVTRTPIALDDVNTDFQSPSVSGVALSNPILPVLLGSILALSLVFAVMLYTVRLQHLR